MALTSINLSFAVGNLSENRKVTELSALESAERRLLATNALATMRLEGLEPSQAAKELLERYVSGAISAEELFDAIDQALQV